VVKAWEKRGDKAEDNHLNLLHNSPPVVAPIVSARFSNIFILSCLVTILCRSILILNCRLSLCKKLSNDCQKVTKTTIRNIMSSQLQSAFSIQIMFSVHRDSGNNKMKDSEKDVMLPFTTIGTKGFCVTYSHCCDMGYIDHSVNITCTCLPNNTNK